MTATCASCSAAVPAGARFCPACASSVESTPPTEERKVATVLFADLVGSTALGEQDWERTRAILDRFYDALAELGERERVEDEAARLSRPGTLLEPFALRALGRVRGDTQLIGRAIERFEALRLHWHAEQARGLL
jgi:class 3 adenylate cyclase